VYHQNNLEEKVKLIQAQWKKYGIEFMNALMEQYDYTNNNLLNKGTTFSKDIITRVTLSGYSDKRMKWEVGLTLS
jgi:hypothetical protein